MELRYLADDGTVGVLLAAWGDKLIEDALLHANYADTGVAEVARAGALLIQDVYGTCLLYTSDAADE